MSRELLSYDETTGLSVYFDYNELTDETTLEYEQDCESVLELNKAMANDTEYSKKGIKNDFWRYASIPVGLQMKWLIEEGLDIWDKEAWPRLQRKLVDPEYKYLRCTTGTHLTGITRGKTQEIIVP